MQSANIVDRRGRCVRAEDEKAVKLALLQLKMQPWIREEAQRQATVAVWMTEEAQSGRRTVYRSS